MTNAHYAWLPPEINSARIFAGPGAAPLLAAARAWDGLAEELTSSASSFSSVTSDLAKSSWQGPSSTAMMALATQYASWLEAAAAQAEAVSTQASAAAAAYEDALAAMVQPAVVAANRALVQALAANNSLGQNTPAIADIEAAYEQMWASDVAAMSNYHADASAAAGQLTPWRQVLDNPGVHFGGAGSAQALSVAHHGIGIGPAASHQIAVDSLQSGTGNIGLLQAGHAGTGVLNASGSSTGFANPGSFIPEPGLPE